MARTLWLFALITIDATVATTVTYLRPIFTILIAIIFLSEKITWRITSGVLISILGAAFVMGPVITQSSLVSTLPVLAIFISPLIWALHDVIVKIQSQKDHWEKQIYIVFLLISIFSFPLAFIDWKPINLNLIFVLAALGFLYVAMDISLANALKRITLVLAAPIDFMRIIFTAIWHIFFLEKKLH